MSFSQKISLKHNLKLNYQRLLLLTENSILQNKTQKLKEVKTILDSYSKDTKNIKIRKYSGEYKRQKFNYNTITMQKRLKYKSNKDKLFKTELKNPT